MRYRAEPGNEECWFNDEAEPLDLRYRAEPGNEEPRVLRVVNFLL
jgi:hypothetical protein